MDFTQFQKQLSEVTPAIRSSATRETQMSCHLIDTHSLILPTILVHLFIINQTINRLAKLVPLIKEHEKQ
jgi:hypothetical protein